LVPRFDMVGWVASMLGMDSIKIVNGGEAQEVLRESATPGAMFNGRRKGMRCKWPPITLQYGANRTDGWCG
jgi:hypothetical protein